MKKDEEIERIQHWCDSLGIKKYTIACDLTVDVQQDVIIEMSYGYDVLPVKLGAVYGGLHIYGTDIAGTRNMPHTVKGSVQLEACPITSLEGGPVRVDGGYWCIDNRLTDLRGSPDTVYHTFNAMHNMLTSLDGAPRCIRGNGGFAFTCLQLKDIRGVPIVMRPNGIYCGEDDTQINKEIEEVLYLYADVLQSIPEERRMGMRKDDVYLLVCLNEPRLFRYLFPDGLPPHMFRHR